tara:strand:+ start:2739 stop:2936 length:198 start_codon:yes stop_codon:yes gene_type:complete
MPFNKEISDHFYELGLDLLFLGYTKEDIEIWIRSAEEEDSFEECDGLYRALNKSNDIFYGEEEVN